MDKLLTTADVVLRTLFAPPPAGRPCPTLPAETEAPPLQPTEKRLSGALMRVNHVGEICAQALYTAQALATSDPGLRRHFEEAALSGR